MFYQSKFCSLKVCPVIGVLSIYLDGPLSTRLFSFFTEMINMISHRDDINQKLREAGCADTHHIVKVIQELVFM